MRVITCFVIAVVVGGPLARAGELELKQFKAEYPEASRIIMDRLAQVKGSGHMLLNYQGKFTKVINSDFDFQVDHGFQKCATKGASARDSKGRGVIFCWGDESGFTLHRESNGGSLTVEARGNDIGDRQEYEHAFGRYVCAPYSISLMRPLLEILNNPRVKDLSAESVVVEGRRCVRIRYLRGVENQLDVAIDLDPGLGWVIVASSVRHGVGSNILSSQRNRYDLNRRQWPMPLSVEINDIDNTFTRCEFRTVEFAPSPPEEFAMSYYGLPDIPGTPKPAARAESPAQVGQMAQAGRSWWRSSLFLGLVALAAIGLTAGFLLRYAAARSEKPPSLLL